MIIFYFHRRLDLHFILILISGSVSWRRKICLYKGALIVFIFLFLCRILLGLRPNPVFWWEWNGLLNSLAIYVILIFSSIINNWPLCASGYVLKNNSLTLETSNLTYFLGKEKAMNWSLVHLWWQPCRVIKKTESSKFLFDCFHYRMPAGSQQLPVYLNTNAGSVDRSSLMREK